MRRRGSRLINFGRVFRRRMASDVLQEIMNTPAQGDIQAVRDLLTECSRYDYDYTREHSAYLRNHLADYQRYKRDAEVTRAWEGICNQFYALRTFIDGLDHMIYNWGQVSHFNIFLDRLVNLRTLAACRGRCDTSIRGRFTM